VTALVIIIACIAFVLVAGVARGNPGRGVGDTTLLVMLLGLTAMVGLLLSLFIDVGRIATVVAVAFAVGFAFDALYGLMAPERQRRRDRQLRRLMRRRA
jgi:hypothetical protein